MREPIAQQPPLMPPKRRTSLRPTAPPSNPQHGGLHAGIHAEDLPELTGPFGSSYEADREDDDEEQEDVVSAASSYQQRLPSSTMRYRSTGSSRPSDQQASSSLMRQGNRQLIVHYGQIPPRASARSRQQHSDRPTSTRARRSHPRIHGLFYLGLGMFVMVAGWWLLTTVGTWWANEQNTWRYGYPRVDQLDAVVGHHDSARHPTHFLALNLDGHIQIIEIPGGDASRERVYLGPTIVGTNAALMPVTLSVADVNGDGKPDLLLHVQGQSIVLLNTGSQFQSPKS